MLGPPAGERTRVDGQIPNRWEFAELFAGRHKIPGAVWSLHPNSLSSHPSPSPCEQVLRTAISRSPISIMSENAGAARVRAGGRDVSLMAVGSCAYARAFLGPRGSRWWVRKKVDYFDDRWFLKMALVRPVTKNPRPIVASIPAANKAQSSQFVPLLSPLPKIPK